MGDQLLPAAIFGHVPSQPPAPRDLAGAVELVRAATAGAGLDVSLDHGPGRRREAEALAAQLREAGIR